MNAGIAVVSNAGPLMVLSKLHLLHLLKELYGYVHIPRSVYDEVVTEGLRQGYEDAQTLRRFLNQMGWVPEDVDPATMPADLYAAHLDRGQINAANKHPSFLTSICPQFSYNHTCPAGQSACRLLGKSSLTK
jgi:hypothetical protein